MHRSRVVVLNGIGSVGKSSTARALQAITAAPFLHVAMDQFIEMAPSRLIGADEGLRFEAGEADGHPSVGIVTGPAFRRLLTGMRHAIAALADAGNDLIVDDVFWDGEEQDYRRLLADHDLSLVALVAPLDVIEAREKARGDRVLGLARWQHARIHHGVAYDLQVQMADNTPETAAAVIRDALRL